MPELFSSTLFSLCFFSFLYLHNLKALPLLKEGANNVFNYFDYIL